MSTEIEKLEWGIEDKTEAVAKILKILISFNSVAQDSIMQMVAAAGNNEG